jgi:hypothetical protein
VSLGTAGFFGETIMGPSNRPFERSGYAGRSTPIR